MIGSTNFASKRSVVRYFNFLNQDQGSLNIDLKALLSACNKMANEKTGAIIVFERENNLDFLQNTGDEANIELSGQILENIFFKNRSGELHTPIPDSFLDGITRREVIKIAKSKGVKVIERKIKPEEMQDFVGCFLTGTAAEVTPVSQISKFNFKVCELITDLNESYQAVVRKKSAA